MKRRKPITEEQIRRQLAETVAELEEVDQSRDALLKLIHGYEAWLAVYAASPAQPGSTDERAGT